MLVEFVLPKKKKPHFQLFFAFGDSIVDTGNNNKGFTIVKANIPSHPGGAATGRFEIGKVFSDLLGT